MKTTKCAVDVGQSLFAGLEEQFIVVTADGAVEICQTTRRQIGVVVGFEGALS